MSNASCRAAIIVSELVVVLAVLSGCATRYEAIRVSSEPEAAPPSEKVLIFGRVAFRENGEIVPPSSWINPSMLLAHAPSGTSLPDQTRQHYGTLPYYGDFVTTVTTDKNGYYFYYLPTGQYQLLMLNAEMIPLLGFDALGPSNAYYLGGLIIDRDNGSNRLNQLAFPEVSDDLASASAELATRTGNHYLGRTTQSPFYPLPCSFSAIGYSSGDSHWNAPKNVSLGAGKSAITIAQFSPRSDIDALTEGKAAAASKLARSGAIEGAAEGAIVPLSNPYGIVLYPFIAPFTIIGGAIIGGAAGGIRGNALGLSESELESLNQAVQGTLVNRSIQEQLGTRILEITKETGANVSIRTDLGPKHNSEHATYEELAQQGFTNVIEIAALKAGLKLKHTKPTRLAFQLDIRVRVVPLVRDGTEEEKLLQFESRSNPLDDLSANRGATLMRNIDSSINMVAHCLSEALFPAIPAAVSR